MEQLTDAPGGAQQPLGSQGPVISLSGQSLQNRFVFFVCGFFGGTTASPEQVVFRASILGAGIMVLGRYFCIWVLGHGGPRSWPKFRLEEISTGSRSRICTMI